jgi:hypothetical protein
MTRTKSSFSLSLPAHFKIHMLPTYVHAPHSFKSTAKWRRTPQQPHDMNMFLFLHHHH